MQKGLGENFEGLSSISQSVYAEITDYVYSDGKKIAIYFWARKKLFSIISLARISLTTKNWNDSHYSTSPQTQEYIKEQISQTR